MFRSPLLADCLAIAAGGAVGALLRHGLTRAAASVPGGSGAIGTTIANVLGCFAIGLLTGYVISGGVLVNRHQLAIRTGLLGSLTTFSTFALETVHFGTDQRWWSAAIYVAGNLGLGMAAVAIGILAGRYLAQ